MDFGFLAKWRNGGFAFWDNNRIENLDVTDIEAISNKIRSVDFFSKMGCPPDEKNGVIYIENVRKVFIESLESDFRSLYGEVEWLPSTPTQEDPFNEFPKAPKELTDARIFVSKVVLDSVRGMAKDKFVSGAHDFSLAARNAACFAFRQYISECYYQKHGIWSRIVELYYSGRWPVGYVKQVLIAV